MRTLLIFALAPIYIALCAAGSLGLAAFGLGFHGALGLLAFVLCYGAAFGLFRIMRRAEA